ncbi:hypothetical protein DMB65_18360 [Flavobacterium cheongpyeongense]|uniref:Uncharacterized protein n=1 Tax=Flavobacterium cheongpyeongense TaxID=2212651 RepID=A0A2V4BK52_9FLAO|nr:hypothetical protein DMB65_18360 [Flavobacterium cheongpyeongense]
MALKKQLKTKKENSFKIRISKIILKLIKNYHLIKNFINFCYPKNNLLLIKQIHFKNLIHFRLIISKPDIPKIIKPFF